MSTTTTVLVRPNTGARITVEFAHGNVSGQVRGHYPDAFDVRLDNGETFTLYDVEQCDARCVVRVGS